MSETKSLLNVHGSVEPATKGSAWKKLFAFFGPAYMVSVGYMDPGNWATDIEGGSKFGYSLLWVLLVSNAMALLLQSLSSRLGIVRGKDLAQCSREIYPPAVNFILYLLAELAIAACDLAEVLGMAIGLHLLLGIPLLWGVVITLLDTVLLLYLQNLGIRKLEAFIVGLIAVIGGCFLVELFFAKPDFGQVGLGFIPVLKGPGALYIAIGIIGATVMPHNLYLHSALVQTRKIGSDDDSIRKAIRYNAWDSTIALNIAFFVNAAILILAGTVFFGTGNRTVASLEDAHQLLAPLMGTKWASVLFAVALIAAGQSSTITGTMAGQIVMEGYLRLRINPVIRRLLTRLLAIVPALLVIWLSGGATGAVEQLLVFSQVLLSMQLAFAVIPLIHFTSDRIKMRNFVISTPTKVAAWVIAAVILVLNGKLLVDAGADWYAGGGVVARLAICTGAAGILVLLAYTTVYPIRLRHKLEHEGIHNVLPEFQLEPHEGAAFRKIALALDFSHHDEKVLQFALRFRGIDTEYILIHVTESVSARMMGSEAADYETRKDQVQLDKYVGMLEALGCRARGELGYRTRTSEISRIVNETGADLLIIGSHGHKKAMDFILGETADAVKHLTEVPVFIAR